MGKPALLWHHTVMGSPERLAEFLRARREQIQPEDVGLESIGRRRVPGLRREELALLAGVSADYYVRLEQGRDHRPSEQILDALARALLLDDDAIAYMYKLARPSPQPATTSPTEDTLGPELQQLLDAWAATPALLQNRRMDTLASNALAQALAPALRPGANSLRALFLDPALQACYENLPLVRDRAVAYLRAKVGDELDDPALTDLLEELDGSPDFRELWARHDVLGIGATGDTGFRHPELGTINLRYWTLSVRGAEGLTLLVYSAAPGSRDAEALATLATLATLDESETA